MSTNVTSGGFPHLYRMDVPGSFVDASAVRSVANADVAELHAALTPEIEIDDYGHLINVATKRALTATEFKQMFYARGDDEFSIANVYDCPNVGSNILASVWGKRIDHNDHHHPVFQHHHGEVQVGTGTEFNLPMLLAEIYVGDEVIFTYLNQPAVFTGISINTTYYVISTSQDTVNAETDFEISLVAGGAAIVITGPPGASAGGNLMTWTHATGTSHAPISRIMNYNKLSSRPDDPSGVDLAYGYANDLQRNFYASHEVMGNLENDLCVKKENWTLCSRIAIADQLHNLSFTAEDTDDVCMKVSCARKWSEVEDALAESCLAENNIIGLGDYVDLYINVRVTNGNAKTKDTIIRVRFTVQMTRGPDDLGNWNVVSNTAASAMLTTGIPYDAPEGGNLQYANAAQTEVLGLYANQERTQAPDTTVPGNLDTMTDPHDHATNDGTGTSAAP